MARARERLRRHRRAHRLGRARRILDGLGRPPGSDRSTTENALPPLEDNTLCHFAPSHPGQSAGSRRLLRPPGLPGRLLSGDARRGLHRRRQTAGSPAIRCPNRRSARSSCTGTAARWKPNHTPAEGHAIEDMRPFEGRLYESVRIAPGDRVSERTTRNRRSCIASTPKACCRASQPERGCRCTERRVPEALGRPAVSRPPKAALWAASRTRSRPKEEARPGDGRARTPEAAGARCSAPNTHSAGMYTIRAKK